MKVKYKRKPPANPFLRTDYVARQNYQRGREHSAASLYSGRPYSIYESPFSQHESPRSRRDRASSQDAIIKIMRGNSPFNSPRRLKDIVRESKQRDSYDNKFRSPKTPKTSRFHHKATCSQPRHQFNEYYGRYEQLTVQHYTPYTPISKRTGPYFPQIYQPHVNMSPKTYQHLVSEVTARTSYVNMAPTFKNFTGSHDDQVYNLDNRTKIAENNEVKRTSFAPFIVTNQQNGYSNSQNAYGMTSAADYDSPPESMADDKPAARKSVKAPNPFNQNSKIRPDRPSIDNVISGGTLDYGSDEDEEESPSHPPTLMINGKQYFSVNLMKK